MDWYLNDSEDSEGVGQLEYPNKECVGHLQDVFLGGKLEKLDVENADCNKGEKHNRIEPQKSQKDLAEGFTGHHFRHKFQLILELVVMGQLQLDCDIQENKNKCGHNLHRKPDWVDGLELAFEEADERDCFYIESCQIH